MPRRYSTFSERRRVQGQAQNDVAGLQATVSGLTTDLGALSALVDQICAVPVIDLVVACP